MRQARNAVFEIEQLVDLFLILGENTAFASP